MQSVFTIGNHRVRFCFRMNSPEDALMSNILIDIIYRITQGHPMTPFLLILDS